MLSPGELERIGALWKPSHWPEATDAYAEVSYRRPFEHHLKRVRHLGLSGGLLIDAGCGVGPWTFAWAASFDRVIGCDIAPRRLAAANWQKERFDVSAAEFAKGDVRRIPAADESADAVFCNAVLSATTPIRPVMQEFFRVLKYGGVCYLGLTGTAWGYERAKSDDPRLADLGRKRIYNTLCQQHLTSLIAAIAPGGARNVEAAACLQHGMPVTDLLVRLGCPPAQVMAAETIARDLGQAFSQRLFDDLAAINAGATVVFGDRQAGRDWEADDVSLAARHVGFGRSEWAPDGWLSLQEDGSVEKAPCDEASPGRHEFDGQPRLFEMLLWKPQEKTELATRRPDDVVAELIRSGKNISTAYDKSPLMLESTEDLAGDASESTTPIAETELLDRRQRTASTSDLSYPEKEDVDKIGKKVRQILERGEREAALRYAMTESEPLLRTPSDALRFGLRNRVFKRFSTKGVAYQGNDFECVDYEQYEIAPDLPLFRGPAVPAKALRRREYFCVMGAAQTFGRLVEEPWPILVSQALGLPAVNISGGGLGPEFFLEPKFLELARNARFVVLQVMSGRSVGCEDYPGGRLIELDGKSTKVNRVDLLAKMAREDPEIAIHYIRRWNANYLKLYARIREAIDRPTLLLWISDRSPEGWRPERLRSKIANGGFNRLAGTFPQLVGKDLYRSVAEMFDAQYVHLTGAIEEATVSRITGQPCPYIGDGGTDLHTHQTYYPTNKNNAEIAEGITPWGRQVLDLN